MKLDGYALSAMTLTFNFLNENLISMSPDPGTYVT